MSLPPPPPPDPRAPFASGGLTGAGPSKKTTLPPPEWVEREGPRSAASIALERHERDVAVARRTGPRAELGQLRARLELARAGGDAEGERVAATALARALAARGSELETATRLARRALVLGEDAALREELSGWFGGLGEPALAAATLRALLDEQSGEQAARTLMRTAVLLSRASDAEGAIEALEQAAQDKPTDPVPLELIGMIGGWAPSALRSEYIARAYLAAAQRHEARGERADAFEDLLRAFEMAPGSEEAAERLSAALVARGRAGAADEVNREHARALGQAGRAVHVRRMRYAVRESDLARALGAALDARLEAELEHEPVHAEHSSPSPEHADTTGFDELLTRIGLHELVAARLEIACDELGGVPRARLRLALGRLYAGPLSSPDRAADAWIDALVSDPSNEEAKSSLRAHAASTRDQTPIVDALIRMGLTDDSATLSDRMACLRELIVLAEQRLSDPGLALWAVERVLAGTGADEDIRRTAARLAQRARLQDEALAAARAGLETASGPDRVERLRRAAVILRGRPDDVDSYVSVLGELVTLVPEERAWQQALERVLYREARLSDLENALTNFVQRSGTGMELERGRVALSAVKRRRGDLPGALRELAPLLSDLGAHPAAWSHALVLSARLGDDLTRALALRRIAGPLPAPLRAIVSSVAAEALLSVGQIERARDAAEQACRADPSLARPIAARAAISMSFPDPGAAAALERATGVVLPRAELCRALSDACIRLGDPVLAVAWTQRRLALKPGDPAALRALVETVLETDDATRIGDALGWLLAQPLPLGNFIEPLGIALQRLAGLDPPRAAALSRRALDVLGPREAKLRDLVLSVADRVGERGLGIAVVERWLAIGAAGKARAELTLELARRRKLAGDADGAARALQRALQDGADPAQVLAQLDSALPARDSDGEIALLEARAGALLALENADPRGMARALRELGAARWDLAADPVGALEAWLRAASIDKDNGVLRLSRDLVAFAGHDEALRRLVELAERQTERPLAAEMLAAAAGVALQGGRKREALTLAGRALELDPSRGDVLAIAERTAGPAEMSELEEIYDKLGTAALGCYGERAVHYRAARQFERRGEPERALGQALRAFEAVPGEGVTFVLITRLAERVRDAGEIVRVLERVASRSSDANARARWLRQAALFAGTSDAGKLERVDVLLRAFSVHPDLETLDALGAALTELVALYPDERETMQLRFERASEALFQQCDGPEGARLAIRSAQLALGIFAASSAALAALERAIHCNGDVDEYASLLPEASRLAKDAAGARSFVEQVSAACSDPHRIAGRAALELAAALADKLEDSPAGARLLVHAARAAPEDKSLVRRADAAARAFGDAELMGLLLDAVPVKERLASLLALAAHAEREDNLPAAADALERVLANEGTAVEDRLNTFEHLRELYQRMGRRDALEQLLGDEISRSGEDGERTLRLTRDLAALVAARGDPDRALRILDALQPRLAEHEGLLGDVVEFARQAGDRRRRADALGVLAQSAGQPQTRLWYLRELALLLEELGERVAAYARWSEVLTLDANDVAAIAALEREAEHRGDYERLVELVGSSRVDLQACKLEYSIVSPK